MAEGEIRICDFDSTLSPALLARVAALEAQAFTRPWGYDSLQSTLNQRGSSLALLFGTHDEPLAFCLYQQILDEASILQMATAPAARRLGHGLRLLHFVKQRTQQRGCVQLLLEVRFSNVPARGLYAAAGFVELAVRRRYYEDNGEDALVLVCPLRAAAGESTRESG